MSRDIPEGKVCYKCRVCGEIISKDRYWNWPERSFHRCKQLGGPAVCDLVGYKGNMIASEVDDTRLQCRLWGHRIKDSKKELLYEVLHS